MKKILITLLFLLSMAGVWGQETVVVGQVFDKNEATPLPFVSIYFEGADFYTESDEEGYFLIKNRGKEEELVFSLIGYHKKKIKVAYGSSVGLQVKMEERQNLLQDILVRPTANFADELMRKVRQHKVKNNLKATRHIQQENVVFLTQEKNRWTNNKLFAALSDDAVSSQDSALLTPLYMTKTLYSEKDGTKELVSENSFETTPTALLLVERLLNGMNEEVNFYHNAIPIMGKNMISPLASIGNSFYRYYLTDSTTTQEGKNYTIAFRTKNPKNLAFNGTLWIDSASLALTKIVAQLPPAANLNYIHRLRIAHTYRYAKGYFVPQNKQKTWYLTYQILKDSLNKTPELLVNSHTDIALSGDSWVQSTDSFAGTPYSQEQLQKQMVELQMTPLYKVANYIADAAFTGYLDAGYVDIGKMVNVMRLTEIEGFRVGLPLRTNERLWKDFSIGGYGGYGFRDRAWKYGAEMQWRLPINGGKTTLGGFYLHDYRRLDYDYNDYVWQNNPLETGDENIVSTIFSFTSKKYLSKREEWSLVCKNRWRNGLQNYLTYRDVTYFANEYMPLVQSETNKHFSTFRQQNISLTTRLSWNERIVTDHFQDIYLPSAYPVLYGTVDAGRYHLENGVSNSYIRLTGNISQQRQFLLGEWRYSMELGGVLGAVPYPLLRMFYAQQGGAYSRYEFAMMNHNEFIADRYATVMGEVRFNGLLFNYLPLIKHLNLRELLGIKLAYGTLRSEHASLLDMPTSFTSFSQPYAEAIVGFTNLLGIISVQSIWRLTERHKIGVTPWGIRVSLLVDL